MSWVTVWASWPISICADVAVAKPSSKAIVFVLDADNRLIESSIEADAVNKPSNTSESEFSVVNDTASICDGVEVFIIDNAMEEAAVTAADDNKTRLLVSDCNEFVQYTVVSEVIVSN